MKSPRLELVRRAAALAALRGWEVLRTLDSDDHELRQLVLLRGAASPAVLRIRAPGGVEPARAQAEIDALTGAPSEHVLALVEVVSEHPRRRELKRGTPPPSVLLEYAPGGLLAELLERRPYLRAGEAATILMAVASGLVTVNERGWAHGALTSRSVVFRDDGCPAIASFASTVPLTPQSEQSDRRGFLRLAERLCSSLPRVDGDRMLEALREPLASGGWHEVADALAVVVEPEAVFVPAAEPPAPAAAAPGGERNLPTAGMLGTLLEGHPAAALMQRVLEQLRTRKRLVWIATAPLAIAVAVLAVMPAPSPPDGSPASAGPTSASSVGRGAAEASGGTVTATDPPPAAVSPAPTSTAAARDSTGPDGIRSLDPVLAAPALLSSRHACFVGRSRSASCLDDSMQPDSALYRADVGALGTSGAASQRDFDGAAFELVQQWGDAALVMATPGADGPHSEPASILLVRNEAGWRLRDVYED